MQDVPKVAKFLSSLRGLAFHLTDNEFEAIAEILYNATKRLLKEQGEE